MIATPRTGWQTLIADLAIILFMVTAGALAQATPAAAPAAAPAALAGRPLPPLPAGIMPPAGARPLAVFIAGSGGPTLAQWLTARAIDPREQLTIVVRYRPGQEAHAADDVAAAFAAAGRAHVRTRIVAEPGEGPLTAGLAFDAGS